MAKSYYPPKSLREATVIARTIVDKGGGQPMMRLTIAKECGLAPGGRVFRDLITSSGGYGLTTGSYVADEIELQDLGRRVVAGELEAAYEALFSHELFAKFQAQYKNAKVPSQQAAQDFLKRDCGVPEGQLKGVYSRLLQDARDWYIVQEIKGAERVVPVQMAKKSAETELGVSDGLALAPSRAEAGQREVPPDTSEAPRIEPCLQLNIAIHIGPDTSDEKIEVIFKNMRKYLLPNE